MLGEGGDVRELERLLELRPRAGAVAQVEQRLAETHACERLASHRAHLAAEPRGVDQVRAGGLEVVGEELGLAEHGGGERLAAAGARLVCLRAQTLGEAGDAVVGVARREHVLGHAQVGVEDAARELRRVPDVGELAPGMLLPAAVQVGDHALQARRARRGRARAGPPRRPAGARPPNRPCARPPCRAAGSARRGPRAARPAPLRARPWRPGCRLPRGRRAPVALAARARAPRARPRSPRHRRRARGPRRPRGAAARAAQGGPGARARPRARAPARPTRRRRGRRPRRRPTRPPG